MLQFRLIEKVHFNQRSEGASGIAIVLGRRRVESKDSWSNLVVTFTRPNSLIGCDL